MGLNPEQQLVVGRVARGVIVAGLVLAGFYSTLPMGPQGADADVTEFSAVRAMNHVDEIAREPHPMGSPEIARVREYLVAEVEALGLEFDLQALSAPSYYGNGELVDLVNVIAWIPGAANTKAVVLVAHYDTVPATPGANDNSAAVAALLETARALRAGPTLANDIVFLFTDGEEPTPHHYGANAFADVPGLVDTLGLVVNFEANGGSGASMLVETNGPQAWLVNEFAEAAPLPTAFSFLTDIAELIGDIGTDFDVFANAGVPGLHFAYLRGSPIYHTAADSVASVGPGSLQHHGENALAVARHFGNLDLAAPPDSGRSVFFTIRPFFVRYPAVWALWLAALVAAGFAWALRTSRRPDSITWRGVVRAAGRSSLAAFAGAAVGSLLWMLLVTVRSSPAVIETYAYLVALLAMGAFVAHRVEARRGHGDTTERRHGRVGLWVLLAVVTAVTLPGFSYLFVWAALAAVAGLLWRPGDRLSALARFVSIAAPTLLLMTPAIDFMFLFAQPRPGNPDSEITATVLLPLLLALLVVALLANGWHHPDDERVL